jgi:methylmalonyl-CoA mutase
MQNWEYTFPPTTKDDWIRQIDKDLKGKPIESLYSEWWPGEPLIPFHHSSDAAAEAIVLPNDLFTSPPRIVESIDLTNRSAEHANKVLLEALQFGTQIFLLSKQDETAIDVDQLLKGVFADMVHWHIDANHPSNTLFQSLKTRAPETTFLRFQRSDSKTDLKTLLQHQNIGADQFKNIKFEYHFSSTGNWVEEASKVFIQLLEDSNAWKSLGRATSFYDLCILKLDADVQYFKHILQTRVLHLLWLNLTHQESFPFSEKHDYLEGHITPAIGETPEHYLIRASMSALAAALTGTTSLCIHHIQAEGLPDFYKRIDRNIHHLLHLESGLPVGQDPLAGAYTLDYYTRLWTARIWNQIFGG